MYYSTSGSKGSNANDKTKTIQLDGKLTCNYFDDQLFVSVTCPIFSGSSLSTFLDCKSDKNRKIYFKTK